MLPEPTDDLRDRVAVVAGGAGTVGGGVVAALLAAGARVAVPGRSPERLAALAARLGHPPGLTPLVGDVADEREAARLREEVAGRLGGPDLVVASVGGWRSGPPLTRTPLATWREVVEANLLPHVALAAAFLPALAARPAGRYVAVVGDTVDAPVAGAAPVSVVSSAVLALTRAAAVETPGVSVTALVLGAVSARPGAPPERLTPLDVGGVVAGLAAGRLPDPPGGALRLPDRRALPS